MPVVHLKNNVVEYEFTFNQKYLFIRGDSGNGKSQLIEIVASYVSNPDSVDCLGDKHLRVMTSESDLETKGVIYFLDENSPFLWMQDSATKFNCSENYFVIISRSRNLDSFKTGLDSLVNIRVQGSYHTVEPVYARTDCISAGNKGS